MYTKQIDSSFLNEEAAREYAAKASEANHSRLHIILAGDEYFVTSTKDVQPYEKFIASYSGGSVSK